MNGDSKDSKLKLAVAQFKWAFEALINGSPDVLDVQAHDPYAQYAVELKRRYLENKSVMDHVLQFQKLQLLNDDSSTRSNSEACDESSFTPYTPMNITNTPESSFHHHSSSAYPPSRLLDATSTLNKPEYSLDPQINRNWIQQSPSNGDNHTTQHSIHGDPLPPSSTISGFHDSIRSNLTAIEATSNSHSPLSAANNGMDDTVSQEFLSSYLIDEFKENLKPECVFDCQVTPIFDDVLSCDILVDNILIGTSRDTNKARAKANALKNATKSPRLLRFLKPSSIVKWDSTHHLEGISKEELKPFLSNTDSSINIQAKQLLYAYYDAKHQTPRYDYRILPTGEFCCQVTIGTQIRGMGVARTKKEASARAATVAMNSDPVFTTLYA